MAVFMLDAVIAHLVKTYGSSYAYTLLYFPALHTVQPVHSAIEAVLKDHVLVPTITTWYSYFPHFYLSEKAKTKSRELCENLKQALSGFDISVTCDLPGGSLNKRAVQQSEPQPGPQPSPGPPGPADKNAVEMVHIVLWSVLFFIVSLVYSCYHLSVIDGSNEPEFKTPSFEMGGGRAKTQKVQ